MDDECRLYVENLGVAASMPSVPVGVLKWMRTKMPTPLGLAKVFAERCPEIPVDTKFNYMILVTVFLLLEKLGLIKF